jgi:hypothetical protein
MHRVIAVAVAAATASAFTTTQSAAAQQADSHAHKQAVISQIVSTSPPSAQLRGDTPRALAEALVRCAPAGSIWYCLNVGFVAVPPTSKAFRADLRRSLGSVSQTGDVSLADRLRYLASLPDAERRSVERREIEQALETDRRSTGRSATAPAYRFLFDKRGARRQIRGNYCGPATLQMIDGNDRRDANGFDSQHSWADDLNVPQQNGTWIGDLVAQINAKTSWDSRAGSYRIQSLSGWSKNDYWWAVKRRVGVGGAPYAEHPDLDSDFYSYLSTRGNYGGHFQMGRGYNVNGGTRYVFFFEPFNEPDWTGYRQTTWGPRRTTTYKAFQANRQNQNNLAI